MGDGATHLPLPLLHARRGPAWLERADLLSFEEITRLVRILAALGVDEVRLTGGEPLVRRDLPRLVGMLGAIPGVRDLSLTTNGVLLDRLAAPLVESGLRRINISLDSLSHVRFAEITRRNALDRVLRGISAAERFPELRPIKINVVAIRGFTEREIPAFAALARSRSLVVRFIEFMPRRRPGLVRGQRADGRRDPRADRAPLAARARAVEALVDREALPVHGPWRRDRLHQPRVGAVLLQLRPHPHHRRRAAAHLPLLAPRDGPPRAAARRSGR
jgi:molybdenum cofactor biosynthesis enzyme MoaA